MLSSQIQLTRRTTPDEFLCQFSRYADFWKEVFLEAHERKASDIHVESMHTGLQVRLRVNGILIIIKKENGNYLDEYLVFLKTMASLDTSTSKVRQDNSFELKLTNSSYRIAISPGYGYGEGAVLRVIREEDVPRLQSLGLSEEARSDIVKAVNQKQGFVLVTGSTGSGKSTTLQGCLMEIDRDSKKVITAEDPVERKIPGVFHQSITPQFGWDEAIRHCLRADPDVILVGEIRDYESANLAVKAAQTGHLLLSTLHTNSVVETIDRLITLGIKNYEIADSLLFVAAQRLENRLCKFCKIKENEFYIRNHTGCDHCTKGYLGRVQLFEYLMSPDPKFILNYDKEALRHCLKQTLEGELQKAVIAGELDYRRLEAPKNVLH